MMKTDTNRTRRALQWSTAAFAALTLFSGASLAQGVAIATTTFHDENVFDIYAPTSDQLTQVQLDAYTDWDFDQTSVTASYSGAAQIFRDLPARNYHVHLLSLQTLYHFEGSDDDEEQGPPPPPGGADSASEGVHQAAVAAPAHSDSSDRFVYLTLAGAAQFDRDEATDFGNPAVYDNSAFEASAAFREPIGPRVSLRPFYTFSYRVYPNISVVSNLQHIAGVQLGSDALPNSWFAVTPAYSYKDYTGSSTFTDTLSAFRVSQGHGKGFGGGKNPKVRQFVFTTPSVNQFSVSVLWKQTIAQGTDVTGEYTRFGNPSGEARVISDQLRGAGPDRGAIGDFTGQNEIFDDHFAYSGDAYSLQLNAALPLGLTIGARELIQVKTYTVPAMDLADSLTLADHRNDHRYETTVALARPILLGEGKKLKPEMEFHYLRNNSNAPYYAFEKTIVLLGIAFEF
jgi:hypothetical protein